MRSEEENHRSVEDIKQVRLRNNRGATDLVPLGLTANLVNTTALQLISRLNRQRAVPIYANVAEGRSQQSALGTVERIAKDCRARNRKFR